MPVPRAYRGAFRLADHARARAPGSAAATWTSWRRHSSSSSTFRIISPTAILGYGFPQRSFDSVLEAHPVDLIAVDAGSIDPGPYYLATRSSFTALPHVLRDLRLMVRGFVDQRYRRGLPCKLVVGSAGGCGTDNQVDILAEEVLAMLRGMGQEAAATAVAVVTSEVTDPDLLAGRPLVPLGPAHFPPEVVAAAVAGAGSSSALVAQMGLEPIISALGRADVVLCGRAYDPAVFAAEPVRRGFPAAMAMHAAKVLECGAIATVPGSGSDCLVAELTMEGSALVWAPNEARRATPLSVAAHTLYEKSHPHCFALPGGVLKTAATSFAAQGRACEIKGTALARTAPTAKLEGAAVRGHRAVRLIMATDAEAACGPAAAAAEGAAAARFTYGVDGVEAARVDAAAGEQEMGIVVSVSGGELEQNKSHLALLRATLLHWGFEGRKATAGNLAFPFSPSDLCTAEGEVLTVCGTRDPAFIANWASIFHDVEAYASKLSPAGGLQVQFFACGLPGMPQLVVEEAIGESAAAAKSILEALPSPDASKRWLCSGGMAADFTIHHLVELDDELMGQLFKIRIQGPGGPSRVQATLEEWGSSQRVPMAEAMADWAVSRKPVGTRRAGKLLGDLARVVRSKNAGVNELTFDIIFEDEEPYSLAKHSPALDQEQVQQLLGRPVLGVYCDDRSLAIKVTCDRVLSAGSAGDRDVYGAQQHRKLLGLRV